MVNAVSPKNAKSRIEVKESSKIQGPSRVEFEYEYGCDSKCESTSYGDGILCLCVSHVGAPQKVGAEDWRLKRCRVK